METSIFDQRSALAVNYNFNQPYVTCHIKVPITLKLSKDFNVMDGWITLSNLDYDTQTKYKPSYGPVYDREYTIDNGPHTVILSFKYNEYKVIVTYDYLVIENTQEMTITKKENVLELINCIWRLLQIPGFTTQYEIITKVEVIEYGPFIKRIYKKSYTNITKLDVLTILSKNHNSLFHYVPFDIINIISQL